MNMKHYKDAQGNVYGYAADGSQDHLIGGKTLISFDEAQALGNQKADATFNSLSYSEKRSRMYPPLTDFADAWVKNDQAALEEYRRKCLEVKAKYPKK